MEEFKRAIILANRVLNRPYDDPDDDLAILARQFLRMRERLAVVIPMAKGWAHEHDVGNNRKMVQEVEKFSLDVELIEWCGYGQIEDWENCTQCVIGKFVPSALLDK